MLKPLYYPKLKKYSVSVLGIQAQYLVIDEPQFQVFINKNLDFIFNENIYSVQYSIENEQHILKIDTSTIPGIAVNSVGLIFDTFSVSKTNELLTIQDIINNFVSDGADIRLSNTGIKRTYGSNSKNGLLNIFDKSKLDLLPILMEFDGLMTLSRTTFNRGFQIIPSDFSPLRNYSICLKTDNNQIYEYNFSVSNGFSITGEQGINTFTTKPVLQFKKVTYPNTIETLLVEIKLGDGDSEESRNCEFFVQLLKDSEIYIPTEAHTDVEILELSAELNLETNGIAEGNGIINGLQLSTTLDTTKFKITSGIGYFANFGKITFNLQDNIGVTHINDSLVSYIALDSTGTIIQKTTPFTFSERRQYLILGVVVHSDHLNVNTTNPLPDVALNLLAQYNDLLDSLRNFNKEGNIYSGNGVNLSLNKSAGKIWKRGGNFHTDPTNPHCIAITGQTLITTLRHRMRDGSETANTSSVEKYWDNNGVKEAIPTNRFTIHRLVLFTSGLTRIQLGQNLYQNMSDALQMVVTETFVPEQNIADNGLLRGYLIIKGDCTDLTDITKAKFVEADKFGTFPIGGTGGTTNLQQAYNNALEPEITTDETRGAVTIKNGVNNDFLPVFETQKYDGNIGFQVLGDGRVKGSSAMSDDEFVTRGQLASVVNVTDINVKYVRSWGSDITGDGSVVRPYKSVSWCESMIDNVINFTVLGNVVNGAYENLLTVTETVYNTVQVGQYIQAVSGTQVPFGTVIRGKGISSVDGSFQLFTSKPISNAIVQFRAYVWTIIDGAGSLEINSSVSKLGVSLDLRKAITVLNTSAISVRQWSRLPIIHKFGKLIVPDSLSGRLIVNTANENPGGGYVDIEYEDCDSRGNSQGFLYFTNGCYFDFFRLKYGRHYNPVNAYYYGHNLSAGILLVENGYMYNHGGGFLTSGSYKYSFKGDFECANGSYIINCAGNSTNLIGKFKGDVNVSCAYGEQLNWDADIIGNVYFSSSMGMLKNNGKIKGNFYGDYNFGYSMITLYEIEGNTYTSCKINIQKHIGQAVVQTGYNRFTSKYCANILIGGISTQALTKSYIGEKFSGTISCSAQSLIVLSGDSYVKEGSFTGAGRIVNKGRCDYSFDTNWFNYQACIFRIDNGGIVDNYGEICLDSETGYTFANSAMTYLIDKINGEFNNYGKLYHPDRAFVRCAANTNASKNIRIFDGSITNGKNYLGSLRLTCPIYNTLSLSVTTGTVTFDIYDGTNTISISGTGTTTDQILSALITDMNTKGVVLASLRKAPMSVNWLIIGFANGVTGSITNVNNCVATDISAGLRYAPNDLVLGDLYEDENLTF